MYINKKSFTVQIHNKPAKKHKNIISINNLLSQNYADFFKITKTFKLNLRQFGTNNSIIFIKISTILLHLLNEVIFLCQ